MNLNNEIDLKIGLFIYNPDQEIDSKEIRDSFNNINEKPNNLNTMANNVSMKGKKMLSGDFGRS
jgi:hypothetical protein